MDDSYLIFSKLESSRTFSCEEEKRREFVDSSEKYDCLLEKMNLQSANYYKSIDLTYNSN
jgi:hypothetical protein